MLFWKSRKAPLAYPAPGRRGVNPRTAVLSPWVRSNRYARVFAQGWDAEAAAFSPQAIAAAWPQIEALLNTDIPSLTHAIIVLARSPAERLTGAQRDRLWAAFRVPIFEQILDQDGTLLAAECEAHNGLHVESGKLNAGASSLDMATCPCGRSSPRLKLRTESEDDPVRAVAAYAR